MSMSYELPTGHLLVGDYEKGKLETLSIGDYGKRHNVKADFLGYRRPIAGVPNTECMPLSEKWVITLSTQYGCPMKCTFCDVPKIKFAGNASENDLREQLMRAISVFPGVKYTERLNIHFARMGDPIFNQDVFSFAIWLQNNKREFEELSGVKAEVIHPVLTTSLPKKLKTLESRIHEWCRIKNEVYHGQAGLQFSINSTCERQRSDMYKDMQLSLVDLARIADRMPMPLSRKYCLNFAYSTDFTVDASVIAGMFSPDKFMIKITPIHESNSARENSISTVDGYTSFAPYAPIEADFIANGFDVLVFVPSLDEENGLVTCGNAVLAGGSLRTSGKINIAGIET